MATSSGQLDIILEHPDKDEDPQTSSTLRSRRSHRKSRGGCVSCKQRRVKCDENLPQCTRCIDRSLRCVYPNAIPPEFALSAFDADMDQGTTTYTGDVDESRVIALLANAVRNTAYEANPVQMSPEQDALHLVRHFIGTTEITWIGSPTCQRILQCQSIEVAWRSPWLLSTILAFSAAHISTASPMNSNYYTWAAVHYSDALSRYREYLAAQPGFGDLDAKLEAMFLHVMLAFFHSRTGCEGPLSRNEECLQWIPSMQGISFLLGQCCLSSAPHNRDLWKPLIDAYTGSTELPCERVLDEMSIEAQALIALLGVCDPAPDGVDNAHARVLDQLSRLLTQPISSGSIDKFVAFIALLPSAFTDLLKEKEPRALLILGVWCAFFGRIDQWWIQRTARTECQKICAYVSRLNIREYQMPLLFLSKWSGDAVHTGD